MDSYTVSQVYNSRIDKKKNYRVYVYYDPDGIPLYVGCTNTVIERLWKHLGKGMMSNQSSLGLLLIANQPDSATWRVDLYDKDDCNEFYGSFSLLESHLIESLSPVLNVNYNSTPQSSRFESKQGNFSESAANHLTGF